MHMPSLSQARRAPRVDVWILGPLPSAATMGGESAVAPDLGLLLQFGFLSHAALVRSAPSYLRQLRQRLASGRSAEPYATRADQARSTPTIRVIQLRMANGPDVDGDLANGSAARRSILSINSPHGRGTERPEEAAEAAAAEMATPQASVARELRRLDDEAARTALGKLLCEVRIHAETVVLELPERMCDHSSGTPSPAAANAAARVYSRDAAMVLMPLPRSEDGLCSASSMHTLVANLPPTVLCASGGDPVVTTEI